jgi:hypothetical protein
LLTFNGSLSGITAVASTFTCSVNPVFTLDDCGSSVSGCGSASGIASVTLTAGNAVTIGTIASASLVSGHYLEWVVSSGTCTALQISGAASY